ARARSADRYVTVKGVAEREAKADLAIWPLSVVGADNSEHPDLVLAASQQIGELAAIGVVVPSGPDFRGPGGGPTFVFTGLNKLKPQMIADATARAREAAEQFARDSHSDLGGIRQANQGVFEILPRDQAPGIAAESQINKTVRVVSTVEYFLKD
ncbi:MAG: SIMPL domain-containing protein, partial [Candidatus Dormibacteraeota bacterium]|nr:SIMPL domain-containing protein [Candidatus Dormibacteraeota bacterium]